MTISNVESAFVTRCSQVLHSPANLQCSNECNRRTEYTVQTLKADKASETGQMMLERELIFSIGNSCMVIIIHTYPHAHQDNLRPSAPRVP